MCMFIISICLYQQYCWSSRVISMLLKADWAMRIKLTLSILDRAWSDWQLMPGSTNMRICVNHDSSETWSTLEWSVHQARPIDALIHALIKLCIDSCFNRDWLSTVDPRLRNMQINPARLFYQRSHQSMANLHIYQLLLRSIRYLVHVFTNHGLIRCIDLCVSTLR